VWRPGWPAMVQNALRVAIAAEQKTTIFQGESFSRTMVIENPQDFRARPRDFTGFGFSITVLEREFSNQVLGDGFREGETRKNQGLGPSSLFFSPLLSEPHPRPRPERAEGPAGGQSRGG
jgi:hypothetical protein